MLFFNIFVMHFVRFFNISYLKICFSSIIECLFESFCRFCDVIPFRRSAIDLSREDYEIVSDDTKKMEAFAPILAPITIFMLQNRKRRTNSGNQI